MMKFRITGPSDTELNATLIAIANETYNGMKRSRTLEKAGEPIVQKMRDNLAPQLSDKSTGLLYRSLGIGVTYNKRKLRLSMRLGARGKYTSIDAHGRLYRPARIVHLIELGFATPGGGTKEARPFIRPAWESQKREFTVRLLNETSTAFDAAAAKQAKKVARAARKYARGARGRRATFV